MALDPQIQALMNAAPAQAPPAASVAGTGGAVPGAGAAPASGGLDPQIAELMNVKSAPPQEEAAAPAQPQSWRDLLKVKPTFWDAALGQADASAHALSSIGATALGGVGASLDTMPWLTGVSKTDPRAILRWAQDHLIYQPRTNTGKAITGVTGVPTELLAKGAKAGGDVVQSGATALGASPEVAGTAGGLVEGGINSLPIVAGEALPGPTNELNIGMARGAGGPGFTAPGNLTQADVLAALQKQGVKVKSAVIRQSGTEPTVVARTRAPLTPEQGNAVANDLGQQAIVQNGPSGGALFGPQADAWGPFNPGYFLNDRGEPVGPLNTTPNPLLSTATRLGVKLTPDQVSQINGGGNLVARGVQSLSGSAKLERSFSKANAKQVNAQINRQVGIPEGVQASPEALDQASVQPNAVYAEAGRAGTVDLSNLDPTLRPFIAAARRQLRLPTSDLSSLDAQDLVTTVRQLRAQGFANQGAPRYMPSQKILGQNQIAAAKALDDALDRHIQTSQTPQPLLPEGVQNWARIQGEEAKYRVEKYGSEAREHTLTDAEKAEVRARLGLSADAPVTDPSAVAPQPPAAPPVASDLMTRLLGARKQLAQIASARRALRPGGNYFAGSFAKQLQNNVPLEGPMRDFGQLFGSADRSFQDVNKIRDSGPFSVLDAGAGLGGLELAHFLPHALPATLAYVLGKPIARSALGSRAFQSRLTGAAPGRPVVPLDAGQMLTRRAARGIPFTPTMLPQGNGTAQ